MQTGYYIVDNGRRNQFFDSGVVPVRRPRQGNHSTCACGGQGEKPPPVRSRTADQLRQQP